MRKIKKENSSFFKVWIVIFALLLYPSQKAFAYYEPGTITWLLQITIAVTITGLLILKSFWKKIIIFFKRILQRKHPG